MTDELQTVDIDGQPLESRMPSAQALRSMHDDFVRYDVTASEARARIQGLVNGNPPFSDKKLRDDGQGYRRNFNPRDAEAIIDSRCAADFNLAFDVQDVIDTRFTPGFISDSNLARSYAQKISRAYTHVFKGCPRTAEAAQRVIRDKNVLGCGFFIFPNRNDFRPKGVMRGRVFFNPTASSDCTDITEVTVIDSMTISEVFNLISRSAAADKAGWNIKPLKKALAAFYYDTKEIADDYGGNYMLAWEDLERRKRANDPIIGSRQHETFPIVHGFITERSGKVSQYVISKNLPAETPEEFLFESFEAAESMSRLIVPMPFDFGDGTLSSVKGYGHRIFALATEAAKSLMRTLDAVDLASSFILQNSSSGDNNAFAMQRFGPVTLLEKGLTPIQTSFSPPVEPSMAAREMLLRVLSNNNGVMRAQNEDMNASNPQKTAEEIRYIGTREATYDKNRMFLTYMRWDAFHKEYFSRLIDPECRSAIAPKESKDAAEMFFTMCDALGVPKELLTEYKEHIHVSATRAMGAGSTYAKMNNLSMARNMGLLNDMTEVGRREVSKELFSSLVGYDSLDRFYSVDGADIPSNESTIANLENNDAFEGTQVIVGVDQNHVAHLTVHLASLMQEAQAFQQDPLSMDLERTVSLFQSLLPHVMRHIELLSGDPTREQKVTEYQNNVKQLMAFYQQVAPMFERVQKAKVQEIEKLRAENQQLLQSQEKNQLEHQRGLQKLQGELEIERIRADGLNEARMQKMRDQMDITTQKAGQALAIQQQKFQAEMQQQMQKMQLDLAEAQTKMQVMLTKANK